MLDRTAHIAAPPVQVQTRPKQISGRDLERWIRKAGATTRAFVCDDLRTGRLVISEFTARQSRALARASSYANTVAKLTEDERARIERGSLTLAEVHSNKAKSSAANALWARAANEVERELGDEAITVGDFVERVLAKIGLKMTTPITTAVNTEAAE
jgi:hypothetical protein